MMMRATQTGGNYFRGPAACVLLHTRYTTAMDGGSAENAGSGFLPVHPCTLPRVCSCTRGIRPPWTAEVQKTQGAVFCQYIPVHYRVCAPDTCGMHGLGNAAPALPALAAYSTSLYIKKTAGLWPAVRLATASGEPVARNYQSKFTLIDPYHMRGAL